MSVLKTNSTNMERALRLLGVVVLLLALTVPTFAQERVSEKVTTIEVKDGKVFVNGEMVKELADKESIVEFMQDSENNFVFFSDEDEPRYRNFRTRSPGYREMQDAMRNVEIFGDEAEGAFSVYHRAREMEPVREGLAWVGEGSVGPFAFAFGQNEEIRKLERKSEEIARKLRQSEGDEMANLNSELDELLNQIFDMKLAEQRQRVEKMSTELDELQGRLRERSDSRNQIIERRLRQLKGDRDMLDW